MNFIGFETVYQKMLHLYLHEVLIYRMRRGGESFSFSRKRVSSALYCWWLRALWEWSVTRRLCDVVSQRYHEGINAQIKVSISPSRAFTASCLKVNDSAQNACLRKQWQDRLYFYFCRFYFIAWRKDVKGCCSMIWTFIWRAQQRPKG